MRIVHLDAQAGSVSRTVAIFGMIIKGSPVVRALFGDPSRKVNHRTEIELYRASLPADQSDESSLSINPQLGFPRTCVIRR